MSDFYQLALTRVPGVGSVTARALLAHFANPEAIFKASFRQLTEVNGIGPQLAQSIRSFKEFDRVATELQFIEKHQIQTLFITDADYPKRLAQCYDAPVLLYYRGTANLNQQKVISVVGTRSATAYGKELCEELLEGLKEHQPLVVSGLAYGIDSMAHKSCLKHDLETVGVLAHGLDRIYPAAHRGLAQKMIEHGGLLTEFPSQTNPDRENFPKRNRIIAGLADATIVVEAHSKGGALITAELANNYNRDVFAFPGRVHDEQSCGCNYLIKTNRANLITKAADLEYLLGWDKKNKSDKRQMSMPLNLNPDEQMLFNLLVQKPQMAMEELMLATRWPLSKLAVLVLVLEMQGLIVALPGKMYQLTR